MSLGRHVARGAIVMSNIEPDETALDGQIAARWRGHRVDDGAAVGMVQEGSR